MAEYSEPSEEVKLKARSAVSQTQAAQAKVIQQPDPTDLAPADSSRVIDYRDTKAFEAVQEAKRQDAAKRYDAKPLEK